MKATSFNPYSFASYCMMTSHLVFVIFCLLSVAVCMLPAKLFYSYFMVTGQIMGTVYAAAATRSTVKEGWTCQHYAIRVWTYTIWNDFRWHQDKTLYTQQSHGTFCKFTVGLSWCVIWYVICCKWYGGICLDWTLRKTCLLNPFKLEPVSTEPWVHWETK